MGDRGRGCAGDVVEGFLEGSLADLGGDHAFSEGDGGGVSVDAVGEEPSAIDEVDRYGGQAVVRIHVPIHGILVEPVSEVQSRVEDQFIQGNVSDLHRGGLSVSWRRFPAIHRLNLSVRSSASARWRWDFRLWI